jgi:signal transduction histidine kinase/CheY-like chemotaxis protein
MRTILVLWLTALTGIQADVIVDQQTTAYNLAEHMLWQDADVETDFVDIMLNLTDDRWQPSPDENMSLGIVKGTYWFKSELAIQQTGTWLLELNNPTLREFEIWLVDPSENIEKIAHSGLQFVYPVGREILHPDFYYQLNFSEHGKYTLMLRVTQSGFLDLPLELKSAIYALQADNSDSYSRGFYYGLFSCVLIFAVTYFLITRDISFLAFSVFICGFSLLFGYVDGIITTTISAGLPFLNLALLQISIPVMTIGIAWFGYTFFDIPGSLTWLGKILFAQIALGCTLLLISFLIPIYWTVLFGILLVVVSIFESLLLGIILILKTKDKIAIPFTLAWAFFGGYIIFIALSVYGIIPFAIHDILSSLKTTYAIQMLFLFIALAMRLRNLESETIQARSESKSKTELLTRVSHEIRTPMNGILGLTKMLDDHIKDEQGAEYQRLIKDSGESLLRIVNDLLDSRQIEEGKFELVNTPTPIFEVIRSVFSILSSQMQDKQLVPILELPANTDLWIIGDEIRIRQILTNLIGNAIKFTDAGSVKCLAVINEKTKTFQITISDTGRGIAPDDQERIFEPFEQAGRSKTEIYSGTGLGLYITHHLAELMQGTLSLESEVGKGTSFVLTLPLIETARPQQRETESPESQLTGLKILVAEDNPTNQIIIKNLLKALGHHCTVAQNGLDVVSEFKQGRFQLILMDCEMPLLDGYDATRLIREYEHSISLEPVPIIALTAHANTDQLEKVNQAGMNDLLTKPIRQLKLNSTIQNVMTQ